MCACIQEPLSACSCCKSSNRNACECTFRHLATTRDCLPQETVCHIRDTLSHTRGGHLHSGVLPLGSHCGKHSASCHATQRSWPINRHSTHGNSNYNNDGRCSVGSLLGDKAPARKQHMCKRRSAGCSMVGESAVSHPPRSGCKLGSSGIP